MQNREYVEHVLRNFNWDAARIPTKSVTYFDHVPGTDATDECHYEVEEDVVEDGESLTELTEDGHIDRGLFGDGAYVPARWWRV